jgi:hypothetical protein
LWILYIRTNKNKTTTTTTTIIKNPQKKKSPRKTSPKYVVQRPMQTDLRLRRYELALSDPFHPDAVGAQIPDMWSAPTIPYHTQGTMTISSNASGVASVVLTGNPLYSLIDMTTDSVSNANVGMQQQGASLDIYGATSIGQLSANLSSCRVVAVGYRMKNQIPPTTATGRLIVASIPTVGHPPGINLAGNGGVSNTTVFQTMSGVILQNDGYTTTTTGIPSSILSFPESIETTIQSIISTSVEARIKPITPQAFQFHSTNLVTAVSSTGKSATEIFTVNDVPTYYDNEEVVNYEGMNMLLLRFEGLPANTVVAEIDFIFHLEGAPSYVAGNGTLVAAAPPAAHVNIAGHQDVLSRVLSKPVFSIINDVVEGNLVGAGLKGAALIAGKKRTRQATNFLNNLLAKVGM